MEHTRTYLFGLMDPAQQERVTRELSIAYCDVYDSLDEVRDLVRDLERTINRVLYGRNQSSSVNR